MAIPTPKPCGQILDPDSSGRVRRLTCRQYNKCLALAAEYDWRSFTCVDCHVDDVMTREEERLEIDGLAALLSSLALGARPAEATSERDA